MLAASYLLPRNLHFIKNDGSRAYVHKVYAHPSSLNTHARINMFLVSGRHLKHSRSIICLVYRSKMYVLASLHEAITRVLSLDISTPVIA